MEQLEQLVENFQKTSSGHDDLCISIYKENFDVFGDEILIAIRNRSLSRGIFPSQLKAAKVVPVFKKGDRKEFSIYRPNPVLIDGRYLSTLYLSRVLKYICI